jgi:UDP-N-acetylmuramate dehydrogenase
MPHGRLSMLHPKKIRLSAYSTIGIGGPAELVECSTENELIATLQQAASENIKIHILGHGSNSLFPSEGMSGLIVRLTFEKIKWLSPDIVEVEAGRSWDDFVASTIEKNLYGVECLSGIPGTVGAAPIQNIGAYGQEVSQTLVSLRALNRQTLTVEEFAASSCEFRYRHSRFKGQDKDQYIILSATFQLRHTPSEKPHYHDLAAHLQSTHATVPATPREIREAVISIRKQKGMVVDPLDSESKSLGSFFMNPTVNAETYQHLQYLATQRGLKLPSFHDPESNCYKISAAWLIENTGFAKGFAHGNARLSKKHCLAIVNPGHATSHDIMALAQFIQRKVELTWNISLTTEPNFISE